MTKATKFAALLVVAGTSLSMADVTLDFVNTNPDRDFSAGGDSITLDFSIDGLGDVSMIATPVGSATDVEYLAAVASWTGPVGTVTEASLFGTTFQLTLNVTTFDRVNLVPVGVERISLDGRYGTGIMGAGGGNGSRVDWTTGNQEILHIAQTGGSAQIRLLDFGWNAASTATNLWDTQLIAGGVDNTFMDLPGFEGTVDVSSLGYIIGSGANELTIKQPLDGSHGLGLSGMTLQIAVPEPATTGVLALGAISMLLTRRFRKHA